MSIILTISAAAVTCLNVQVHDGDTIRCGSERVRIQNIDAPELPDSPKCDARTGRNGWCDTEKAYEARDALRSFLSAGRVIIQRSGVDRYGRTLASVSVNGVDAGEYLIANGLARRWR